MDLQIWVASQMDYFNVQVELQMVIAEILVFVFD
jgi:hypothetical protein